MSLHASEGLFLRGRKESPGREKMLESGVVGKPSIEFVFTSLFTSKGLDEVATKWNTNPRCTFVGSTLVKKRKE